MPRESQTTAAYLKRSADRARRTAEMAEGIRAVAAELREQIFQEELAKRSARTAAS